MKIFFIAPAVGWTGASKMMAWVANKMASRGHDVKVVTFFSNKASAELHEKISYCCLGVFQSNNRVVRNTFGMLKTIYKLDRYVKREKPDVMVSFLDSVGYVYLPIAKKRCKIVVSERSDPYKRQGVLWKIKILLMKFADLTVFQTEGAREFFKNSHDIYQKSVVIPNPVVLTDEVKALLDIIPLFENRDNCIVTAGRLSLGQKRQDILLEAFDIVHKKHPELKLVIYGEGEDKEKIQEMITQLELDNCVTLAGKVLGVERKILNAKAFVLTSDYEGIPNALVEALSVGVPCLSTDCSPGGARLLIDDGENGFLVPCGNAESVARGIIRIIENKSLSDKFTANAQKITGVFSEEKIADMWEKILKE